MTLTTKQREEQTPLDDLLLMVIYKLGNGRARKPVAMDDAKEELQHLLSTHGSAEAAIEAMRAEFKAKQTKH